MSTGRRVGARELLDTVLDAGSWQSWDAPPLQVAEPGSAYAAELAAAADKAGTDESVITGDRHPAGAPGRRGGRGVRLPRRVDRPRRGGAARPRRRARHPRGAAAVRGPDLRRHPHAGGHPGLRGDGQDLRRRRGAQGGRPALPRLPAPPHDRRRVRLLGLARPRDRGRARRAGRLPRAAGLRGAVRRAVPAGRADLREPLRARAARRRAADRGAGGGGRPGAQRADGTARGAARGPRAAPREPAGPARLGVDHPLPATRAAGGAGPAQAAAPPTSCPCTAPARASRTRGC